MHPATHATDRTVVATTTDNRRVLHGRTAFDADEGVRHFRQVYIEADDLSGRRRLIESMAVTS